MISTEAFRPIRGALPRPLRGFVFVALFVGLAGLLVAQEGTAQEASEIELSPPDAVAQVQFTQVRSVRELSDGSLIVADRSEKRLVLVGWKSPAETVIGREGEGPGEYQSIGHLFALAGDSSLFTDPRLGRWSILEGETFSQTFNESLPLTRILGWKLSGSDEFGHVLGTANAEPDDGRRRPRGAVDTLLLVLGDLGSQRADTLARIRGGGGEGYHVIPAKGSRLLTLMGGNPLSAVDQALLFPDGWIAVASVEPYRVDWRTPEGHWIQGPALPFDTAKPNDGHKRVAMAWYSGGGSFEPEELRGWPEIIPPFQVPWRVPVLLPAPDGRLLILRTPTVPRSPNRYDVVDRDGQLVGFILLPPQEILIGSGRESVFVLSTDEWGLQTLTRHPWPMGHDRG